MVDKLTAVMPTHEAEERTASGQMEPGNTSQLTAVDLSTGFVFEGFNDTMEGVTVDENHDNFITAYNMLTGIRYAVSNVNAKLQRPLTAADFDQTAVYSFNMESRARSSLFQFKDYMPWVFRHLRESFGLDAVDYLMSLTAKYIVNELGSPGKSGSFFYYSRDYRFIIKTIHHSEHKQLRRILYDYYKHVQKNPETLVSQFYGLHRVKLPLGRKIHFVVMNNVFPALYEIHYRYDLKGSTLGRAARPNAGSHSHAGGAAAAAAEREEAKSTVYKDLDWIRAGQRILLGPERATKLKQQLRRDVAFLKRINVMDYSFLVGIHDMNKGNQAIELLRKHCLEFGPPGDQHVNNYGNVSRRERREFVELQNILNDISPTSLRNLDFSDDRRAPNNSFYHDHGGFQSTYANDAPGDVIYYVGIIDFLTEYSFRKQTETFWKGLRHKKMELSAIPSHDYGERFLNFVCTAIGIDPKDKTGTKRKESAQSTRTNYRRSQGPQQPLRPAQSLPQVKRPSAVPSVQVDSASDRRGSAANSDRKGSVMSDSGRSGSERVERPAMPPAPVGVGAAKSAKAVSSPRATAEPVSPKSRPVQVDSAVAPQPIPQSAPASTPASAPTQSSHTSHTASADRSVQSHTSSEQSEAPSEWGEPLSAATSDDDRKSQTTMHEISRDNRVMV